MASLVQLPLWIFIMIQSMSRQFVSQSSPLAALPMRKVLVSKCLTFVCKHTCKHACKCAYVHAYIRIYIYVHIRINAYIHRYINAYICTYMQTYIPAYCTYVATCWRTCINACTYMHIYTFVYMHTCLTVKYVMYHGYKLDAIEPRQHMIYLTK